MSQLLSHLLVLYIEPHVMYHGQSFHHNALELLSTRKQDTVLCRYNAVNFHHSFHNRHPIAFPWGRGMGCLLWVWNLIYFPLLSWQCRIWYQDKLDRAITALDCNWTSHHALQWRHMSVTASQGTKVSTVCSATCSGPRQGKRQSPPLLALCE